MAVRTPAALYENAFLGQHQIKMYSINSTKLYLIKNKELINSTK
jgi:hypothetical protein